MIGFLCINKREGVTSRDVVNRIQRAIRPTKVGHAGTLDPLATGVLAVAVGRATKLVQYVQMMPKQYFATFELGKTSDTEDITGEVSECEVSAPPNLTDIESACQSLTGNIMQRPPQYSALRVKGKRVHELARQGKSFELAERPIEIHSIRIARFDYPKLELDVTCGSGTYIRSLGRDIGEFVGCGAVMSALTRTAIGDFRLKNAISVDELENKEAVATHLLPPTSGVATLPRIELSAPQVTAISFGQKITLNEVSSADTENEIAAFSHDGVLVAVLARSSSSSYRPAINFIAKS